VGAGDAVELQVLLVQQLRDALPADAVLSRRLGGGQFAPDDDAVVDFAVACLVGPLAGSSVSSPASAERRFPRVLFRKSGGQVPFTVLLCSDGFRRPGLGSDWHQVVVGLDSGGRQNPRRVQPTEYLCSSPRAWDSLEAARKSRWHHDDLARTQFDIARMVMTWRSCCLRGDLCANGMPTPCW